MKRWAAIFLVGCGASPAPPAPLPAPPEPPAAPRSGEAPVAAAPALAPDPPPPPPPCGDASPPDMACIPAGTFRLGLDDDPHRCVQSGQPADFHATTVPARAVTLSAYFIDLTEVTVEAYRACVDAGGCKDVWPIYPDFNAPKQPMTGVSWYEAQQFCEAQGKRLPTEAEWEHAAAGPGGTRTSFGDDPVTCQSAVIKNEAGRSCGVEKKGGKRGEGKVLPVGSRPPGHFGLFDMMGNAEEWVFDWWSEDYASCGAACAGTDPRGPCDGASPCPRHSLKVVKGGSWYWEAEHATAHHRRRHFPANRPPGYHHFGFRCAKSAADSKPSPDL